MPSTNNNKKPPPPPLLLQAIENECYKDAIQMLQEDPKLARKQDAYEKKLPLHFACENNAPIDVINALLKAYPDATRVEDNDGRPPLHFACGMNSSIDVINALLKAYPEAARVADSDGNLPLHCACENYAPVTIDAIDALLKAYPDAIRGKNCNGSLPLHIACGNKGTIEVIEALLKSYPEATREKDNNGILALHLACKFNAPIEVIDALLRTHPEAIREKNEIGSLPLHCACEKEASMELINALLKAYPEATREKDGYGNLPLHIACLGNNAASIEVIDAIIKAYPEAIGMKGDVGLKSLHLACWNRVASDEVVISLLKSYPQTTREKDKDGKLPLHVACENNASIEVIDALLRTHPEAAREEDEYGNLPLHYACENNASSIEAIEALLDAYPEATRVMDSDGSLPLFIICRKNNPFDEEVVALLLDFTTRGMSPKVRVIVDELSEFLLKYGEKQVKAFAAFLDRRVVDVAVIAKAPDSNGRTALSSAGPLCRAVLKQRLFLCGRYELGEQVHSSVTSRVCFAVDHLSENGGSGGSTPSKVALKFLLHRDHFRAEIDAREQASAAKDSFLPVDASFDSDADLKFNEELVARKLDSHRYMLVMPAGDRSLEQVIVAEFAEKSWLIEAKRACRELGETLVSFHSAGFVHGDIKPRNVMRVGARYKLIDFDAAVAIGTPLSGSSKLSTAYAPPEAYIIIDSSKSNSSSSSSSTTIARNSNLLASTAADAWSFGVTLYRALVNSTLVRVVADDAAGDSELLTIAEWSEATKSSLLSSVPDIVARNLLGQLLQKDPKKRLSLTRALEHPFFTGKKAVRLVGDAPLYDVFLSYRVDSDIRHAEMLYHKLTNERGLKVWWDRQSPEPGQSFEESFCRGIFGSATMVCLLSREAINSSSVDRRNISKLTATSDIDWVLLEWRLAAELKEMGQLHSVFPIFIGDKENSMIYSDYFKNGCDPGSCLTGDVVVVASIESKVSDMLRKESLGRSHESKYDGNGGVAICQENARPIDWI